MLRYAYQVDMPRRMESEPDVTFTCITNTLRNDASVDWSAIRNEEMRIKEEWNKIAKSWKEHVIKKFLTPGLFKCGGDRVSATFRAKEWE